MLIIIRISQFTWQVIAYYITQGVFVSTCITMPTVCWNSHILCTSLLCLPRYYLPVHSLKISTPIYAAIDNIISVLIKDSNWKQIWPPMSLTFVWPSPLTHYTLLLHVLPLFSIVDDSEWRRSDSLLLWWR